jgi:hypothetical protein
MTTRPVPLAVRILLAVLLVGLGIWFSRPLLAQKAVQSPGDFYLAYVAAAEKMKSFKDIAPYLPADQVAMMSEMPKDFEKEMLQKKQKELVTGVKVLKESPYQNGYVLELEGTRRPTSQKVKGWAQITKEGGAWKLVRDDWSGVPPPAVPKIPASVSGPGAAVGELTVNGQTAKLLYATATAEPDHFDKTKTAYRVTLSDVPWNSKDEHQNDKVEAGTLHYVELSIADEKRIDGLSLHHRAFSNGAVSTTGPQHKFEAEKVGPNVVAGRAYLEGPQSFAGDTFYYAATFRAPVEKPGR